MTLNEVLEAYNVSFRKTEGYTKGYFASNVEVKSCSMGPYKEVLIRIYFVSPVDKLRHLIQESSMRDRITTGQEEQAIEKASITALSLFFKQMQTKFNKCLTGEIWN